MTTDALQRSVSAVAALQGDADYRVMPHNDEVEQALLGALLVNNRALEKVSEFLRPEHFYNPVHGRIFEAIAKFIERGQDASPITLKSYFEKDQDLSSVGGGQYLADLASHIISVVNVEDYGRTVYELHLRRALVSSTTPMRSTSISPRRTRSNKPKNASSTSPPRAITRAASCRSANH